MPTHRWVTAEEFERLTGSKGSVYIGPAPARRPTPSKTPPRVGLIFPGEEGYDHPEGPTWGLTMNFEPDQQ